MTDRQGGIQFGTRVPRRRSRDVGGPVITQTATKDEKIWASLTIGVRKVDEANYECHDFYLERFVRAAGVDTHDIFLSQNSSSFLLFFIIILLLLPIYLSRFVLHSQVG